MGPESSPEDDDAIDEDVGGCECPAAESFATGAESGNIASDGAELFGFSGGGLLVAISTTLLCESQKKVGESASNVLEGPGFAPCAFGSENL